MAGWMDGQGSRRTHMAMWGPVGPCVAMSAAWQDGRPCAILCRSCVHVASCGKLCDPMLSICAVKLWKERKKPRQIGKK